MPEASHLHRLQASFTAHIRNPAAVPSPRGVEKRRMKIYNDLVYNNIESFLISGFPVLYSLHREEDWQLMVRDFIAGYRCHSPYFLEISQEFLQYLMTVRKAAPVDPPYMQELAHYEWVELALDVAVEEVPALDVDFDCLGGVLALSPLAWSLRYQFPVHRIGPGQELDEAPAELTYLIVYRNREDQVKFVETNSATARLLELVADNSAAQTGQALLERLAAEMNTDPMTPVVEFGARMLEQFLQLGIVARAQ